MSAPVIKGCKSFQPHGELDYCTHLLNTVNTEGNCNLQNCPRPEHIQNLIRRGEDLNDAQSDAWLSHHTIDDTNELDQLHSFLHGVFVTLPKKLTVEESQIKGIFDFYKRVRFL